MTWFHYYFDGCLIQFNSETYIYISGAVGVLFPYSNASRHTHTLASWAHFDSVRTVSGIIQTYSLISLCMPANWINAARRNWWITMKFCVCMCSRMHLARIQLYYYIIRFVYDMYIFKSSRASIRNLTFVIMHMSWEQCNIMKALMFFCIFTDFFDK